MHGTSMRTGGAHMPPGTCTGMCTMMVLYTTSRTCSSPTNGLPADRWGARSAAVGVGAVDLRCSGGIFATMGGASRDGGAPGSGDARAYL